MKKLAVLSLSGGMDSSTLLLNLLSNGYEVTALSFDYGQKHNIELERAKSLVKYLNSNFSEENHRGDNFGKYYPINHKIIKLDGLQNLLHSNLVQGGEDVPEGHYKDDNMRLTVVPNRNKIFSSIIQAAALSLATSNDNNPVKIAMGIHAGDHDIYPDCRQEFRDADHKAFEMGNWDAHLVSHYTPYLDLDKFGILKDGEYSCQELGIDFNEVYKRTITSYKPIYVPDPPSKSRVQETLRTSWGKWYSDYKSASSVERVEAFIKLGRPDPAEYADETGPVSWDKVELEVQKVLNNE